MKITARVSRVQIKEDEKKKRGKGEGGSCRGLQTGVVVLKMFGGLVHMLPSSVVQRSF